MDFQRYLLKERRYDPTRGFYRGPHLYRSMLAYAGGLRGLGGAYGWGRGWGRAYGWGLWALWAYAMGLWAPMCWVSAPWGLSVVPVGDSMALSLALAVLSSYHLASFFSFPTKVIIHLLHPC